MSRKMSRRVLLQTAGTLALAAPVLYACAPKATPAAATAPAAEQKPATKATEAPKEVATSAPAAKGKADLVLTLWAEQSGEGRTWPKDRGEEWAKSRDDVNLKVETVSYNEMPKKQLAAVASGTLWDVMFNSNKWGPYSAFKGVYLFLDDLIAANKTDLTDIFPAAVEGCKFEGKMYAMPVECNTGNVNTIYYNANILQEKGLPEPTDNWSYQEFAESAAKATDATKKIFGTDMTPTNYYDFSTYARSWGSDIFDAEGKKFQLVNDPKVKEALQWVVSLRTQYKCAPNRDDSQSLNFVAGQIAYSAGNNTVVVARKKQVADKFKMGVCLGPKNGDIRGYSLFIGQQAIGATTKNPDLAFSLLSYITSKETAQWSFVNQGQPPCRLSVFRSKEANDVDPVFPRIADWMTDGKSKGPFPMPYNLRFQEVQDTWANTVLGLLYGEEPFDSAAQKVQDEVQKVMDQPRG